jgi:hypothetical protein
VSAGSPRSADVSNLPIFFFTGHLDLVPAAALPQYNFVQNIWRLLFCIQLTSFSDKTFQTRTVNRAETKPSYDSFSQKSIS